MRDNPKPQFYFTTPELWKKLNMMAKQKRREPTLTEIKLWSFIRDRKISKAAFRRQYDIERFIVDFFSDELKLVVEVDGDTHEYTKEENGIRQNFLESEGLTVLHFSNQEVMNNINAVLKRISNTIAHLHSPSPLGEAQG